MNRIYLIKRKSIDEKNKTENYASYHILNERINEIIKDYNDINRFSLNEVDIRDILEEASYFGLFNEDKVLIIDDVKYFGGKANYEADFNYLIEYLKKESNNIFIFLCDDVSKTKNNTKEILKLNTEIIDVTNISSEDKVKYIKEYIKNRDIEIDDIDYLLKNCYSNLDFTLNEIDKISNIDKKITKKLIDEYGISLIKNDNLSFDFSNAVINRKNNIVFSLFDELLKEEIDIASIIGLLANSYENMYMIKECLEDGLNDEEIANKLGFSTARVYVLKKNAKFYTLEDLKEKILELCDVDIKTKTGYNPVYVLKEFLLNI